MSHPIPQHIYTSSGRINFETVAVSPGVPPEIVKQLEARAQSYPNRRQWGGDPPIPPFVVRGFRLANGEEHEYGVGLLLYIGEGLTRAEGNYICHSYVIPRELLEQQDYNLPWIAACLPINFGYYPAKGSGADTLDPLPFNVDPAIQFKIFSFVAQEMKEDELRALIERLIKHVSAGGTLDLEMPPPHSELGRIFSEVMGVPAEAAPNPDALRLLRLAGVMAILPGAFKKIAAFTVNDGGPPAGDTGSDSYSIQVTRTEDNAPPAGRLNRPWLDYCLELAAKGRLEELQEMQSWLTRLLPGECSPSSGTLDVGFMFYRSIVASAGGRPPDARTLIKSVGSFEGHDVDVDTLYEAIRSRMPDSKMDYEDQCSFIVKLCKVIATAKKEIPAQVFGQVMECLKLEPGRKEGVRQRFLLDLPEPVQAEIWWRTFREDNPPGRVPWKWAGPDPDHLNFALTAFEPGLIKDGEARRQIVRHLAQCLSRQGKLPENFYRGSHQAHLDHFLHALYALTNRDNINKKLLGELEVVLAESFSRCLPKADYEKELWRVVNGAVAHGSSSGMPVLSNFAHQFCYYDENAVMTMLLRLPFKSERRRTREFLYAMNWRSASIKLLRLLGAVSEMADVLETQERFDGEGEVEKTLREYHEGYRLRELDQLQTLAETQERGLDITALLSLFRHGRKVDHWAELDVAAVCNLLDRRVKGQDGAIEQVVKSVRIAKHNVGSLIDDSVRTPAMVLFFVGATGVGKTLMARTICEAITGTEENLKRIDMSEYQREHTDQRLIGPPPGYVGHLEGGQLTNWVFERPHSVVLFDEIEKAHERIFDIFLQMLDGARLTDGKGQTVDMSQMILIFTSNIGVAETMGANLDKTDRGVVEAYYRQQVERFFNEDLERPEIFNRLKRGIVVFDYIGDDIARRVIEARLIQMAKGIARRTHDALRIHFDPNDSDDQRVVNELLNMAGHQDYGLRDVNNVLFEKVAYVLAELLDDQRKDVLAELPDDSRRRQHRDWRFRWNETDHKVELAKCSPQEDQ